MSIGEYSEREERLNFLTHALALLLSLIAAFILFEKAQSSQKSFAESAALIFSGCLSFTFLSSSAYHAARRGKAKLFFKKLDHAAIFIMMLGIYVALALLSSAGSAFKIAFIGAVSAFALAGVGLKFFVSADGTKKWSIPMYILFGMSVIALFPFLSLKSIIALLSAAAFDLLGICFYVRKDREFTHAIWHLFSMSAACFDWLAVWFAL